MTTDAPNEITPAPRRYFTRADLVAIILLAGLALRLVYVANIVTIPWNDMAEYHAIAGEVAAGRPFGEHNRFPLFIGIIAGLYRLLGVDPLWPRLWNVFCSMVLMLLLYRLTLAVTRRTRLALAALAVAALHPDLVLYCGPVLYEMTMMLLIALTLYAVIGRGWHGLGGVGLALAVLAKPTNTILLPFLFLFAWRGSGRPGRARALALALAFIVVMLPWWARNRLVSGGFSLAGPGAGLMFYLGNHPGRQLDAFVEPELTPDLHYYRELSGIYRGYETTRPRRALYVPPGADRYYFLEALRCIRAQPGEALANHLRKLMTFYSGKHCWFLDYYSSYNLARSLVPEAIMIALLALALYSVLAMRGNRRLQYLLLMLLAYGLVYAFFSVLTRYRLAILPLTIVAAAAGLGQLLVDARRRRYRRLAALALLLILFTITTAGAV